MILLQALVGSLLCIAFLPIRTAEGIVTDPSGREVPGATVQVRGTSAATSKNNSGCFPIAVTGDSVLLEVAAAGYIITVAQYTGVPMKIVLQPAHQQMQEVVVVGFLSARKADMAGGGKKSIFQSC